MKRRGFLGLLGAVAATGAAGITLRAQEEAKPASKLTAHHHGQQWFIKHEPDEMMWWDRTNGSYRYRVKDHVFVSADGICWSTVA